MRIHVYISCNIYEIQGLVHSDSIPFFMSINGRILFIQIDIRLRLVVKHKYVVYQIKRANTSYRAPDMDVIVINISALIQKCIYTSRLFLYDDAIVINGGLRQSTQLGQLLMGAKYIPLNAAN